MSKHHFIQDGIHYSNLIKCFASKLGLSFSEHTLQEFVFIFEQADRFEIYLDVSTFSWDLSEIKDKGEFKSYFNDNISELTRKVKAYEKITEADNG